MWLAVTLLCAILACARAAVPPPNILLIIADDLGWNDVGFHGLNNIPTPNIDALAASGLTLQNYYVTPICTPSRAALMTGKYPIHNGMQHWVLYGMEPWGLPLTEKILPQYLRELGYNTHLVGKWHLGLFKKEYLPLNRGFESHIGHWTGKIDMFDHTTEEKGTWGFDFRRGFQVADGLFGKYATDIYTEEAVKIIENHNATNPLFLMIAHSAMHSGNSYEFIRAPDDLIPKFDYIQDYQRRKYAAALTKLDESIGKVVSSLQEQGLLENTIILFSTDNGGAAGGFNDNAASNYPLRGVKNTHWEGGVRGAGVLWSPLLENKPRVATQRLHLVDWLPTLLSVAGWNISELQHLDGIDQWEALSKDGPSRRTTVLHNIDNDLGISALTVGAWKVMNGTNYNGKWDDWYGPSGREGDYNTSLVFNGLAGSAIAKLGLMPTEEKLLEMRNSAEVKCKNETPIECKPLEAPCLFNIEEDPCEYRNLAAEHEDILKKLMDDLSAFNKTAVPPNNKPLEERADPKYWGRVFTNFDDYKRDTMKMKMRRLLSTFVARYKLYNIAWLI